jgi:Matrixin
LPAAAAPISGPISFFPEIASLGGECAVQAKVPIAANTIVDIQDVCVPSNWRAKPASPTTCTSRLVAALAVRFQGRDETLLVEHLVLDRQYFHLRRFGVFQDVHGDKRAISSVERVEWCTNAPAPTSRPGLPADSCSEPRQIAVAFDYGTPLNNKILTNGFSFHIRLSGTPPASFDEERAAADVLASFGRSLTLWTAALQDNDALLTPSVRAFVQARQSKSTGGFVLLTPPQVIRLRCPHTATFVVELNFGGDGVFPANSLFLTLAKARVEGRTHALNMRDVTCFNTFDAMILGQLSLRQDNCVNLLPVLMHELGHAFGLDHIPVGNGSALMNPVLPGSAMCRRKLM